MEVKEVKTEVTNWSDDNFAYDLEIIKDEEQVTKLCSQKTEFKDELEEVEINENDNVQLTDNICKDEHSEIPVLPLPEIQNYVSVDNVGVEEIDDNIECEYFPSDIDSDDGCETRSKNEVNKMKKTASDGTIKEKSENSLILNQLEEPSEIEPCITIRQSTKTTSGKQQRNKIHSCLFCNKFYKELSKHLICKHASELEVAKILAFPAKSGQRRKEFIRLSRVGDYYHNCEVLKRKQGELILLRLPSATETNLPYHSYGPCPDCLGFMTKKHIWHHMKYGCPEKQGSEKKFRRQCISESTALLSHTFCDSFTSELFNEHIISKLQNDNIALVCQQDSLIVKFGYLQFEKYHSTQNELIRQSMRQLARLLIELRRIDVSQNTLASWLKPINFDKIILAVKNICKVQYIAKSRPDYSVPSLALKIGYSLKKCIYIQKSAFLGDENIVGVTTLDSFLRLMELEWSAKISSSALATLIQRKMNTIELLPLTDDLIKLNNYLNLELKKALVTLKQSTNYKAWANVASITLAKMVLFNKRRSGEASRMTCYQYLCRPNWKDSTVQEFKNTFTELEMQLADRLTIVQTTGKRNRTVNVLLTPDLEEAVDCLLISREKYVLQENAYLFARSSPSTEYIEGHDCLRTLSQSADLNRPELINGTKLRKYVATVCQVFNLTENETDWLARHLGHNVRVHREFYRLHESSVELTKVSRILLAVEKGEANKFKGKPLDKINIGDLPEMAFDDDKEEEEETEISNTNEPEDSGKNTYKDLSEMDIDDDLDYEVAAPKPKLKKKKQKSTSKTRNRRVWTTEESDAVLKFFKEYVKINKSAPGKFICTECKNANHVLHSRTWKDIKWSFHTSWYCLQKDVDTHENKDNLHPRKVKMELSLGMLSGTSYFSENAANGESDNFFKRLSSDQLTSVNEKNFEAFSNKTIHVDKQTELFRNTDQHLYKCHFSNYTTNKMSTLVQHMQIHTAEKPYACDICSYECTNKTKLAVHHRIHTGEKPYACDICSYKCANKSNLGAHIIRSHTSEKPYACDTCSYKCVDKASLTKHIRIHTGEKPYACDICSYTCAQKAALTAHIRIHTGEKPYACDICSYKFAQKATLAVHIRIHTGEKPYACDLCSYKCAEKATLAVHIRIHTGEKPYACDICSYKCTQQSSLAKHIQIHHTSEKPYGCDICGSKFSIKSTLTGHMQTHTSEKPYVCYICNNKYTQKGSLATHIMRIHTGEKPYACDICSYKCVVKSKLTRHIRCHTGEKPYACAICSYKSATKSSLSIHMLTHTGEKRFVCDICGSKFTQKSNLDNHIRFHKGEKPFACDLCGYRFVAKYYLSVHMRTHTGEKPYACDICSYKCTEKAKLVIHNRTHTGEKPYACNICSYKCFTKSMLTNHIRIHTGETPYACNICSYTCATKTALTRHILIHTGEKPHACHLCSYRCTQKTSLAIHIRMHTGEKPYACDICNYKCVVKSKLARHVRIHTPKDPGDV